MKELLLKIAKRTNMSPDNLKSYLVKLFTTATKTKTYIPNDFQMMSLLIVIEQYKLNPTTGQIFALPSGGKIIPYISVDGWAQMVNSNPLSDGVNYNYSDEMVKIEGSKSGKTAHKWIECVMHRKDREHPTVIREYFDEVYNGNNGKYFREDAPWNTHPNRQLRHKAYIQAARTCYSLSGVYDEDEAHLIANNTNDGKANAANVATKQTAQIVELPSNYKPDDKLKDFVEKLTNQALNVKSTSAAISLAKDRLKKPESIAYAQKELEKVNETLKSQKPKPKAVATATA